MLPFALSTALVSHISFDDIETLDRSQLIFLLATTSDSYEYSRHLSDFTLAAHRSCLNATFRIVDVAESGARLTLSFLPAVICVNSGRRLFPPFSVDDIITFCGDHAIGATPFLRTEEELQEFFDTAGFGLLCSFRNASDETLPELVAMYQEHFNELTLAYCDPELTGAEAFFLYRHTDNALVEVQRTLFGEPADQVERILAQYAAPDVAKAEMSIVPHLERHSEGIVFLALETHDKFYLTPEQVDLAKEIQLRCGMRVLYELSMFTSLSAVRYGFPENVGNGQLRVVRFSGDTQKKYLFDREITGDQAGNFCSRVKNGEEELFWKSEPIPPEHDGIVQKVVADNILEYVKEGLSIVGLFWLDDAYLRFLVAAAEQAVRKGYNLKIATFALARNDWPGPNTTLYALPRLVTFRDGELVSNVQSANTTELVLEQLIEQLKLARSDRDL
jgi:hypothetical protein